MAIDFLLDYGWLPGDGDPGLALTATQKALFSAEFIAGVSDPVLATIGKTVALDGNYYYIATLLPDLTAEHPWYPGYWLLNFTIDARIPETGERFGWANSGADVKKLTISGTDTIEKVFKIPLTQVDAVDKTFKVELSEYEQAAVDKVFIIQMPDELGSVVVDIHQPETPVYGVYE